MLRSCTLLRVIVCLVLPGMALPPAAAGDRPPDFACRVERLAFARAACLGALADQWGLRTEGRIAAATADLQGAYADEILTFEADLAASQARWRAETDALCRDIAQGDGVAFQACRLDESVARDRLVAETLTEARAELGATPLYERPESVEVLVPLPGAPDGPDADVRLPLQIPISP